MSRSGGYKCYNIRCSSCIGKTLCGEPADAALGCENRIVSKETNADRIRDTSDEELAAYLAEISGGTILKTYKQLGLSLSDEKSKKYLNELTAEYLKRLQQPAEED